MFLSHLNFNLCMVLVLAVMLIAAAPTQTDRYPYKVAKKDDIVRRGTRTGALLRRASPLPGQTNYAVFENQVLGGNPTSTNADTIQPNFDACAHLCTLTSDCQTFRWNQVGTLECAMRVGSPAVANRPASPNFRAGIKGVTCAQAKAMYPDLTTTCVEEFH